MKFIDLCGWCITRIDREYISICIDWLAPTYRLAFQRLAVRLLLHSGGNSLE